MGQGVTIRSLRFSGLLLTCAVLCAQPVHSEEPSTLERQFRDPPSEARPRVWWHWLNGNITKDGIAKDLAWMKRIGIAGVQTFDINFSTPTVVDPRLIYMTPQWQDAFRFAASQTAERDMELTIAASPGWSETGGPWVPPADGMKKLVWSVTDVGPAQPFAGRLPAPPDTTGPFQELPLKAEPGAEGVVPPRFYADVAVLAFPITPVEPLPRPRITMADGSELDATRLTDGRFGQAQKLVKDADGNGATLTISFDAPQTVRGLNLFSNANNDMFNGATFGATLEADVAGQGFVRVADLAPALVPGTVSFNPVRATKFRVRFTALDNLSPLDLVSAPGYAGMNYTQYIRMRDIELSELRLLTDAKVNHFEQKSGAAVAEDYHALDQGLVGDEAGIPLRKVIDLTGHLRADGSLQWTPPRGHWRIVRYGYSLTGKTNHPAPVEATGLEVDKMDAAAVRRYMQHYLGTYRATVGADLMGERGVNAILTDSTEVGSFNWTPGMREAFRDANGYDMLPWMPALSGHIVGTRTQSDKFLYDFRRTIARLHATAHYGTVAAVAHENGMKVYGEALEGWRVSLGDDLDMRAQTDVPMAALWTFPRELGPRPLLIADMRTASSSAHIRGQRFAATETMTSSRFPWAHGPADLRHVVDTAFVHGINRIIVHTSPHQPVDDKRPGLSLRHIGQFFTRHESWADMAKPWVDYIARSSHLLQQGRNVADVAYFLGEEAPAGALAHDGYFTDVPVRYGYDLVNASAVLDQFSVDNGDLVTKGGARYRALYLAGSSKFMTMAVLRKLHELARSGATIIGDAPRASPSLADESRQFDALVRTMWGKRAVRTLGKGQVVGGRNVEAALQAQGTAPDAEFLAGHEARALPFVHRTWPGGDLYFVQNPGQTDVDMTAHFRVTGHAPEIWDAASGEITPVSYATLDDGRTRVPLRLAAGQSRFIVFTRPTTVRSLTLNEPDLVPIAELSSDWEVRFEKDRGAPERLAMPKLTGLHENAEPGVRYFSGIATYTNSFDLPHAPDAGQRLLLDMGAVGDMAELRINGKLAGAVWSAPYRIDIAPYVTAGRNTVEIRVANLWANRLIGDAQPGAVKIGWTSIDMYKADAPLRPSGLIGPVRLLAPR